MKLRTPLLILVTLALALSVCGSAAAHKAGYSPDGKIKIVWGFLNEPAVTMTILGLDITISDNATGALIDGVTQNTVQAAMHYGEGTEWEFKDFGPVSGQHGHYTAMITLTQPGIYTLHLQGTINGSDLGPNGVEIPSAHAIEDISETYFPPLKAPRDDSATVAKLQSDVKTLQEQVAALNAKIKAQAETPSTVVTTASPKPAPGFEASVGLVALGAVALAMATRRRG
ncbi:MAG: hypothetical protein WDA16_00165 [Candidatus Thermoplasmatota archaeon]